MNESYESINLIEKSAVELIEKIALESTERLNEGYTLSLVDTVMDGECFDGIKVVFVSEKEIKKIIGHVSHGAYSGDDKIIYLLLFTGYKKILREIEETSEIEKKLRKVLEDNYMEILIHELTHAYDLCISDNNIKPPLTEKEKRELESYIDKYNNKTITPEELEKGRELSNKYMTHYPEVNARFAEAVFKTRFTEYDIESSLESDNNVYVMREFKDILDDFRKNMPIIDMVSDKQRKRIIKRILEIYNKKSESIV